MNGDLPAGVTVETAVTPDDFAEARALFEEYAKALGVDLCFQGFSQELETMEQMYAAPQGGLLLARADGRPVGCVAVRPFGDAAPRADGACGSGATEEAGTGDTADSRADMSVLRAPVCEMKRLYVRPELRGAQLGRRLAVAIVRDSAAAGYATMVLDTLDTMAAAQALYRTLGFREIEPYYENPLGQVTFMALDLTAVAGESLERYRK